MAEEPKFESLDRQIQASEGVQQSYDSLAKSIPNPFDASQIGGMLMKSGQIIQEQSKQFQETINHKEKKLAEATQQAVKQNTETLNNTLSNINAGLDENGKPAEWTPEQKIEKVQEVYKQYEEGLNKQYDNYNTNFLSKFSEDKDLHSELFGHMVKSKMWGAFSNANKVLFEQNKIIDQSKVEGHLNQLKDITRNEKNDPSGKAMYNIGKIEATENAVYFALSDINLSASTGTVGNYFHSESKRTEYKVDGAYSAFSRAIKTSHNPHIIMDALLEKDDDGNYIAAQKLGISSADYEPLRTKLQHDTSHKMVGDIQFQIKLAHADGKYETKTYTKDGKTVEERNLVVYNPFTGDRLTNAEITKNDGIYKYLDQNANPSSQSGSLLLTPEAGIRKASNSDKDDSGEKQYTISSNQDKATQRSVIASGKQGRPLEETAKENLYIPNNSPSWSGDFAKTLHNNGKEVASINAQHQYSMETGEVRRAGGYTPELGNALLSKISNPQDMNRVIATLQEKGDDWDLVNQVFGSTDPNFDVNILKNSPNSRDYHLRTLGNIAHAENDYYKGASANYVKMKSLGVEMSKEAEQAFLSPNLVKNLLDGDKKELKEAEKTREKTFEKTSSATNTLLKAGVINSDTAKLFNNTAIHFGTSTRGSSTEMIRNVFPNSAAIGTPYTDTMYSQRNIENTRAIAFFPDIKNQTATGYNMKDSHPKQIQDVLENDFRKIQDEVANSVKANKHFQNNLLLDPSIGTTVLKQDPDNPSVFYLAVPLKEEGGKFKNITNKEGKSIKIKLTTDKDGRVVTDYSREKLQMKETDTGVLYSYPSSNVSYAIPVVEGKKYETKNKKSKLIKEK